MTMLMTMIEIIWGGSLLAIVVMGCIHAVSPTARRRLMRDAQFGEQQHQVDRRHAAER